SPHYFPFQHSGLSVPQKIPGALLMAQERENLTTLIDRHKRRDQIFAILGLVCLFCSILTLTALLVDLALDGLPRLSSQFFFSFPSRFPERAGILSAWVGSTLVM